MTLSEPAFSDPFQPVSNCHNTAQFIDLMLVSQVWTSQPMGV